MSALPELPPQDQCCVIHTLDGRKTLPTYLECSMREYGDAREAHARKQITDLVQKVHSAKGRYHSQLVMCDLYDACGIPNERPTK